MKFERRSQSPLKKKARRGFKGYPVATVAFYGPDDKKATTAAVGVVLVEGAEPVTLERWFAEDRDVRADPAIGQQILQFIERHGVRSVVMADLGALTRKKWTILTGSRALGVHSGRIAIAGRATSFTDLVRWHPRAPADRGEGLIMRMTLWSCVLVSLIAGRVAAQSKPDFSGQWVLVTPSDSASNVARELAVQQSIASPLTVLTVERRSRRGVRSESYKIGVEGGTVRGLGRSGEESAPNVTRFSVRWDGDRLVIESGSYSGPTPESGPYTEHKEVWALDAEGRLLMTVSDRGSGAESRTTRLTYKRR